MALAGCTLLLPWPGQSPGGAATLGWCVAPQTLRLHGQGLGRGGGGGGVPPPPPPPAAPPPPPRPRLCLLLTGNPGWSHKCGATPLVCGDEVLVQQVFAASWPAPTSRAVTPPPWVPLSGTGPLPGLQSV
jgi:hypothetical protein